MSQYRAYLAQDWENDPLARSARLYLVRVDYPGATTAAYITRAGNWVQAKEGERPTEDIGLVLPVESIIPIHDAIESHLGLALHSATESKVLREWLEVEKHRVDLMLHTEIILRDEPAL